MSRKNKAFRAWSYQNPEGSAKDAWDAAWANEQSMIVSLRHKEKDERIKELEAQVDAAETQINAMYHSHKETQAKLLVAGLDIANLREALDRVMRRNSVNDNEAAKLLEEGNEKGK